MEDSNKQLPVRLLLEQERSALVAERQELLAFFVEATERNRSGSMRRLFERIERTNEFLDSINRIDKELLKETNDKTRRYVVSSLFLHECFKELTADRDEQFFFLTGTIVKGVHVLDQRLVFQHAKRSMVGVVGNHGDTHRLLIKLEQFGHRLLAHFHSHPGNGPEATRPSGTDTGFQKRLEDAGYPAVAAIFSRDGYVRFFRLDNDLEVEIYGEGVEQHDKNSFRLTAIS